MDKSQALDALVLGKRVRDWRLRRGLSQQHLARAAGITQAALSNYENGKREPSLSVSLALSAALDITLGDLIATSEVIVLRYSRLGEAISLFAS